MPFLSGLDLAQTSDFSALATVEQTIVDDNKHTYQCRHLERFKLGTSYVKIVDSVASRFDSGPLQGTTLGVDQTGVGRPVVDLMRYRPGAGWDLKPVTITAGHQMTVEPDGSIHVPKKDLIDALLVVYEADRIKMARSLTHASTIKKELATFKRKITLAGNTAFEAWRDSDKDDLVLALAIAVWLGERFPVIPWNVPDLPESRTIGGVPNDAWDTNSLGFGPSDDDPDGGGRYGRDFKGF